ncbi:MAG TPA: cell envelope integrity EipB family protein [Acetobacteraceae bacterium]|nr:cell envelope integrity EipB family protein [Acetobacteraceae bacterium]
MRLTLFLAACLMLAARAPAHAAPVNAALAAAAARLTGQHAVYALTLDRTHNGDVVAAHGTMTFDVADACDAWATNQRLEMTLINREGQNIQMVSDYATWESKDGMRMRFHMRQSTDSSVTEEDEGRASVEHPGGPGEVHYTLPEKKTLPLPAGTLFPMTHTARILVAAAAGQRFTAVPLFDGTGPNGAQDTSIVVVDWQKPKPEPFPPLSSLPSGRVRVAFFNRSPGTMLPDYEVGMRYWEDGVADGLDMDFGDFVMNGKLKLLTIPKPHC